MSDKIDAICQVLDELRTSCIQDPEGSLQKYNMLFLGAEMNTITSLELAHTLKEKFGMAISSDELTPLIPIICKRMQMTYEPLRAVNNLDSIYCYMITLHD